MFLIAIWRLGSTFASIITPLIYMEYLELWQPIFYGLLLLILAIVSPLFVSYLDK